MCGLLRLTVCPDAIICIICAIKFDMGSPGAGVVPAGAGVVPAGEGAVPGDGTAAGEGAPEVVVAVVVVPVVVSIPGMGCVSLAAAGLVGSNVVELVVVLGAGDGAAAAVVGCPVAKGTPRLAGGADIPGIPKLKQNKNSYHNSL